MRNLKIIDHPLIKYKLSCIRNKETSSKEFREYLIEISMLMGYEIFKLLTLVSWDIDTPISKYSGYKIKENINLYPILRAGQGMLEGFLKLVPNSKVGHIGMYRGKNLIPKLYLKKFPYNSNGDSMSVILDPIVATGGSLELAINNLKEQGVKKILFVGILGYRKRAEELAKIFLEVDFYFADLDGVLNKDGYIVPGMGDAGDRIYGTK